MMPNSAAQRRRLAGDRSAWCRVGRIALAGLATSAAAAGVPLRPAAQEPPPPGIRVAPTIVAEAGSEVVLAIEVTPLGSGPPASFMSLRGLPPAVALQDGHAVGPGVWAVPISALPLLKAQVPARDPSDPGRPSEIVISLIAMDGRLLAQAKSTLIIRTAPQPGAGVAARPAPASGGAQRASAEPAASSAPAPEAAADQRARAERLLARGEAYLANGNVMGARDFFERAADAGLAASALQLAATYDPVELKRLKVQGVKPDVALARKWYERARQLGAAEAAGPLMRLGQN